MSSRSRSAERSSARCWRCSGSRPTAPCPADRLIEGLWGEQPPPARPRWSRTTSGGCARRWPTTAGAEIVTRGRGYELRIDPELVDVRRLERLVAEADRAADAGEPADAAREALALLRGGRWPTSPTSRSRRSEIRRLEELRLDGGRAGDRRRPGRRPPPGGRRRDRRAAGREPAARAAARAADARAVSLRPPGRGARGLPRGPAHAGRGDRRRARPASCGACTTRSCARTRRWTSSPPLPSCRASSTRPASPPLIGRDGELRRLRAQLAARRAGGQARWSRSPARTGWARPGWRRRSPARRTARARRCSTRPGTGAPEAALAAIAARARGAAADAARARRRRPRARRGARRAARARAGELRGVARPGAGHRPGGGGARAARAARVARARAARRRARCARSPASTRRPAANDAVPVETLLADEPRRRRAACTRRRASGRGARRRAASTRSPAARRPAAARRARSRPSWPAASSTLQSARERAELLAARRAPALARRLPVQGPRDVRRRRRRVLLRARAARRRAGRAPRRRAAARGRRPVGQRQVVGAPRRAAARARAAACCPAASAGRRR